MSFISANQACNNAESEVPDWDWNAVQDASQSKWEDILSRVAIDVDEEDPTIVELLYSSVRSSLTDFVFLTDVLGLNTALSGLVGSCEFDGRESILVFVVSIL